MDDYDAALRTAETAFARRVVGLPERKILTHYAGPFDYWSIVREAPLPRDGSQDAHRKAWAVFRRLFNEAWEKRAA